MEQTYNQLEEDEERFRKLQSSDQANFNDRLDTLQVRSCFHLFSFSYHVLPYYPKNNFKEIADSLTDFEFINISALRYKSPHIRHEQALVHNFPYLGANFTQLRSIIRMALYHSGLR